MDPKKELFTLQMQVPKDLYKYIIGPQGAVIKKI